MLGRYMVLQIVKPDVYIITSFCPRCFSSYEDGAFTIHVRRIRVIAFVGSRLCAS